MNDRMAVTSISLKGKTAVETGVMPPNEFKNVTGSDESGVIFLLMGDIDYTHLS